MDYIICRRQMSSVLCLDTHRTLYRINHLFQNGRLLLTCTVFTYSYKTILKLLHFIDHRVQSGLFLGCFSVKFCQSDPFFKPDPASVLIFLVQTKLAETEPTRNEM